MGQFMKKNRFRIISFVVSIIFLISSTNLSVLAQEIIQSLDSIFDVEDELVSTNPLDKIYFYCNDEDNYEIDSFSELTEATNKLHSSSSASVSKNSVSEQDALAIDVTIRFDGDFTQTEEYSDFVNEQSQIKTAEEARDFRIRLTEASKKFHDAVYEENVASLEMFEYNDIEHIQYSPFVKIHMDADKLSAEDLQSFAGSSEVVNLSVAFETSAEPSVAWDIAMDEINASDIIENSEYTGEGINIGIYEGEGVCDLGNANLLDKNIVVRMWNPAPNAVDPYDVPVTTHATRVTSIIALMAPDANLFVAMAGTTPDLSWFISNYCDIINCSFAYPTGEKNDDETYGAPSTSYRNDLDGVYDYQVYANLLTIVVSAGNYSNVDDYSSYNPNRTVLSPGKAFNVITVGGVDRVSEWWQYKLKYDDRAAYNSIQAYIKPEISAMMEVEIPNITTIIPGENAGTSFSAPQVTAAIALLMESSAIYRTKPSLVKALLMAYAKKTDDYTEDSGYFDDRVGAGCLDVEALIANRSRYHSVYVPFDGQDEGLVYQTAMNVSAGEVTVALAYSVYRPSKTGWSYLTDYSLVVVAPDGTAYYSDAPTSSVEMVRFTTATAGLCSVYVYLNSYIVNEAGENIYLTFN